MTIFDAILLFSILFFAGIGWRLGIIKAGGYFFAAILGSFLAGMYFDDVANFVGGGNFARVASFALIGMLVTSIGRFAIWLIDKAFGALTIIPFTSLANRLIGGAFGLIGALIGVGLLLTVVDANVVNPTLESAVDGSRVAGVLMFFSKILLPFLPDILRGG